MKNTNKDIDFRKYDWLLWLAVAMQAIWSIVELCIILWMHKHGMRM